MERTLTVHRENVVSRFAYLLEQRMKSIHDMQAILDHPEKYAKKFDFEQVAYSLKNEAEALYELIIELQAGERSIIIGPELERLKNEYVKEILGNAAE